ncbi:hypothetical protein ACQPTN_05175 [Bradyrhizobium sp. 13971]
MPPNDALSRDGSGRPARFPSHVSSRARLHAGLSAFSGGTNGRDCTSTVVQQAIGEPDMSPLERLLLCRIWHSLQPANLRPHDVDLDLTTKSWIVRRSPTLEHVSAVSSLACLRMHADGSAARSL